MYQNPSFIKPGCLLRFNFYLQLTMSGSAYHSFFRMFLKASVLSDNWRPVCEMGARMSGFGEKEVKNGLKKVMED